MHVNLLVIFVYLAASVDSSDIEDKVTQYFKSDVFKTFQKLWRSNRLPFENAIRSALQESYGNRGMNVYVRRSANAQRICTGLYGTDSVIDRLLMDVTFTGFPNLVMPQVTFALSSNFLRVEAGLSRMILEAKYALFRNASDVVHSAGEQATDKSPFSYAQVQPYGELAIVAEDCAIDGFVVTKLSGMTINLGHDTFRVQNCKFTVEISSQSQPPVIAPYFTFEQTKQLQNLLTRPIRAEMMPKLQAAVFSYINTSLIFGPHLPKFREYQNNMFKESAKYVSDIAVAVDNKTVEANLATLGVRPVQLTWKTKCPGEFCAGSIVVENVTVHGLDTLYSSHSGGPCQLQSIRIAEALRFHSLMVRGNANFKNDITEGNHDFVTEIHDVAVNFEVNLEKPETKLEFVSWRSLEISILELDQHKRNGRVLNAFIHGYLENELPILLSTHLSNIYKQLTVAKPENVLPATNCDCGTERQ